MARRALWRVGAAKDAVPRIAHLDRDRSLVEDAKRDPARFDALYRRYLARVYSYAYYELGDHHPAEDATEATFVSALTNLHRFEERARPADGEGASTFRVWLFQIARNEVAGERRRMRRRPTEPIGETVVADPLDVESAAVRRDEARAAWRAVGRLPGERRQAMVLRFVDELQHRGDRGRARSLGGCGQGADPSRAARASRGISAWRSGSGERARNRTA